MRTPRPPLDSPPARSVRSVVFDVLVSLFAFGLNSTYAFGSALSLSAPVTALVVVALTLPLLVRRRWPMPVFVVIFVIAAATGWWALQAVWSPALVIALYTVAVLRPRRDALIAAAALAVATVVAAIHVLPHNWYPAAISLVVTVIATTVLGLYMATRRALVEELRDRAQRLEREREQLDQLAAAGERDRIAREMHDIVAHHLTVMVALADGAAAQSARSPEQAADAMRTVAATGRLALTDTRQLLGVLGSERDPASVRTPLPNLDDLDELIERVRATGLPVRYQVDGSTPAISPGVQLTLYRLVQEALTNTMKYAGSGSSAEVRVHFAADEVRIEVEDDGAGLATASPGNGSGRGLAGMRERLNASGGEVRFGPGRPQGWQVSARLPLERTAAS
jgi:signal transduction histidine kinase